MTSIWHNQTLTLDQQLALKNAAVDLAREFDGTFGRETIERFLHTSYDEFAERAIVLNFLPLLAEKFARQRLHALAKVEGKATRRQARWCCSSAPTTPAAHRWPWASSNTSQATRRSPGRAVPSPPPASTRPRSPPWQSVASTSPAEYPKPWTDEVVRAADVVITMGCGDACPVFPGRRYEEWVLDDPAGMDVAHVRPVRDEIERRVRALLADLVPSRT